MWCSERKRVMPLAGSLEEKQAAGERYDVDAFSAYAMGIKAAEA
jgi:hypothetical protein